MGHNKILLLVLGTLVWSTPVFAKYYDDEIKAIKAFTASVLLHGADQVHVLGQFKNAWEEIAFYTNQLDDFTYWSFDPKAYTDPTALELNQLTYEKAFVEAMLQRLAMVRPPIEAALKTADDVAIQYPELQPAQAPMKAQVLSELDHLSTTLADRSARVEENLEVWRKWQMELAMRAEVEKEGTILDQLAVQKEVGEVMRTLNRLRMSILEAIYARDFEGAKRILLAHSWYRSVAPLYFADKITADFVAGYLKTTLAEAQTKEAKLIETYNVEKAKPAPPPPVTSLTSRIASAWSNWHLFAEEEGGSDREGHDNGGDTDEKDLRTQGDDLKKEVENTPPGTQRSVTFSGESGDHLTYKVDATISKGVCVATADGGGTANVHLEGSSTFVSTDHDNKPIESKDLPGGAELNRAMDKDTGNQISKDLVVACTPNPSPNGNNESGGGNGTSGTGGTGGNEAGGGTNTGGGNGNTGKGDVKDNLNKINDFVDRAYSQADKEDQRQELTQLKQDVKKANDASNDVAQKTEAKIVAANVARNRAVKSLTGVNYRIPPPPPTPGIPPKDGNSAVEAVKKLRANALELALEVVDGVSDGLKNFFDTKLKAAGPSMQGPAKDIDTASKPRPRVPLPNLTLTDEEKHAILNKIVDQAKTMANPQNRYTYASKKNGGQRLGPNGFDCSGFVQYIFAQNGVGFKPVSAPSLKMDSNNKPVPSNALGFLNHPNFTKIADPGDPLSSKLSKIQIGDITVFEPTNNKEDPHVGLVVGVDPDGTPQVVSATSGGGATVGKSNSIKIYSPDAFLPLSQPDHWGIVRWNPN